MTLSRTDRANTKKHKVGIAVITFDTNFEIVVVTDPNENGIGALILHKYEYGSLKAVAHASCSFAFIIAG